MLFNLKKINCYENKRAFISLSREWISFLTICQEN